MPTATEAGKDVYTSEYGTVEIVIPALSGTDEGSGTVTSDVKSETGVPETKFASSREELEKAVFTAAELARIASGDNAKISLFKQIGGDSEIQIFHTNGEISISIKMPDELINKDSSMTRTYRIVRVHEGKAEVMQESLAQNVAVTAPKTDDNVPFAIALMFFMAGAVIVIGTVGKKKLG